jgi:hypothetical protein
VCFLTSIGSGIGPGPSPGPGSGSGNGQLGVLLHHSKNRNSHRVVIFRIFGLGGSKLYIKSCNYGSQMGGEGGSWGA